MWEPKTGTDANEDFYLGFREVQVAAGWNVYKAAASLTSQIRKYPTRTYCKFLMTLHLHL